MNNETAIKNLNAMKMNYDQRDKRSIPIRTINMSIEALEKQIPKTAPNVRENGLANILFGDCPICKSAVYTDEKYCGQCGKALKWGE